LVGPWVRNGEGLKGGGGGREGCAKVVLTDPLASAPPARIGCFIPLSVVER